MIPGVNNPQAWNRYSYVLNNPIIYNDPSGHEACDEEGNCYENGQKYRAKLRKLPLRPSPKLRRPSPNGSSGSSGGGLDFTGYSDWEKEALLFLHNNGGSDAQHGVEYMLANGIHVEIGPWWHPANLVAGAWFNENTVYLPHDTDPYALTQPQNFGTLALIIHEALHIEQGFALSHSWEGERLAWQVGLRVLMKLKGITIDQAQPTTVDILDATDPMTFAAAIAADNPDYLGRMTALYPEYPGGVCRSLLFCFYISLNSK